MYFSDVFLHDLDWRLASQIVIKTLIMFGLILAFLRLSGKKGVRQLSVFEVAIIIGLGSAAGDPMANADTAILPAVLVFSTILLLYRLLTWAAAKSERFEQLLEGTPLYIIQAGEFVLVDEHEQNYAKDEFFAEMRQQNIEHVGQVETAILETNGQVSFFYYADEQVKAGLPILPHVYQQKSTVVSEAGCFACTTCGHVVELATAMATCGRCQQTEWVRASTSRRRT